MVISKLHCSENYYNSVCIGWLGNVLMQGQMIFSRRYSETVCKNESGKYSSVTHCLFDLDGTLVNSEVTHHKLMRQLCKQFNATYTTKLEKELLGSTNDEICTKVVERLKLPIAADELLAKLRILASKHLPHAPLMKGAEKLLYHLHKNKVPFALVTNATKTAVSLHEKVRPELFSLFNHKVCWHDPDVKRPKPFPDPYLIGAKRFNVKPEMCLAFEDTIVGTKAALAANMQVVMIPCTKKAIKGSACATLVLQSLLEFKPEIFGLPPFK